MTELELYKFVDSHDCKYHWYDNSVILFVDVIWVDEFNELFDYDYFDSKGQECTMMKGYFCFWMRDICEYYGIVLENIFKGKNI